MKNNDIQQSKLLEIYNYSNEVSSKPITFYSLVKAALFALECKELGIKGDDIK